MKNGSDAGRETIKDRLSQYIRRNGVSKNEFYLKAGLSNGFLDKDRGFNTDALVRILEAYPDIDPAWLVLGRTEGGKRTAAAAETHTERTAADRRDEIISRQAGQIDRLIGIIERARATINGTEK